MNSEKERISKNCIFHFLSARAGDCIVLEFDNKDCIIIDCGYKSTYYDELKPLLVRLKKKGCKILLMIITHMDQDHIEGAIEFIYENGKANNPAIINVENIWINGFFNTLFMNEKFANRRQNTIEECQKIKSREMIGRMLMRTTGKEGGISAYQSRSLEELCFANGYNINAQFQNKKAIRRGNSRKKIIENAVKIGECTIAILGPSEPDMDNLATDFDKHMKKSFGVDYAISNDKEFGRLFELIMGLQVENIKLQSYISSSIDTLDSWLNTSKLANMNKVNKSSIVVEIIYNEERFLLTGDSDSESWCEYLEEWYDVIKISHHGTTKPNIALLDKTLGGALLISTDGVRKNHPENDFIARAILKGNKKLYFNYDIKQKQKILEFKVKYKYTAIFQEKEI